MITMPGFTAERSLALTRGFGRGRARTGFGRLVTAQAIHRHEPLKEPLLGSGGSGGIVVDVGPAMTEPCVCPCCTIVAGHMVCCLPAQ